MIFEQFTQNLPGVPAFRFFRLHDVNPLSGHKKIRVIGDPNESMRIVHERLINYLRGLRLDFSLATGAEPGNSPAKSIRRHRRHRYFYLVDISSAFPSVQGWKLAAILCGLDSKLAGQQTQVLQFLRRYCLSETDGLVVGASASPILFNIYAGVLVDWPLEELCQKYDLTCSRYLDDLTFSSPDTPIGARKRKAIRQVITEQGLAVNHRKCRVYDLAKGPIVINGIGLNLNGRTFVPRHYFRKIRGLLHQAMTSSDVSPHKVHGIMGVFFSITRRFNRTEKRLVETYQSFRRSTQKARS